MATAAERLALGYTPTKPGTAVVPRPYTPNFTIPDPRIEAKFAADSAQAAHGERVNPIPKPPPTFAANDPRAYGDGRFGATPNPGQGASTGGTATQAMAKPTTPVQPKPFYSRPIGRMASGAASGAKSFAGKAAGLLSAPAVVGAAGLAGAAQGFDTDTEQYAKRFGLEHTEPGLMRDIGIRSLGVASDVGNNLTLGLAGNFYRDKQEDATPAVTPNPAASPLAQMDPTSPSRQDPANPMNPQQGASAALAAPVAASNEVRPGIYQHGRGQFSDSADGMGFAKGFTGQPGAQNNAAAEALAARRPLVQAAQAPQGPTAFIPKDTGGYGLLDRGARERRSAMMDAQAGKPGARTALKSLLEQQAAEPSQQIERDRMAQSASESAADRLVRGSEFQSRLGEAAADRALRSQEVADNSLTNKVKRDAAGVELTAAQRRQALEGDYLNAETDAARDAAAKKIQALSGKPQPAEWGVQVTPGAKNIDGSTTEGSIVRFNKATGQVERVDGGAKPSQSGAPSITADQAGKSAFDALPKGARYVGPDGKTYTKN